MPIPTMGNASGVKAVDKSWARITKAVRILFWQFLRRRSCQAVLTTALDNTDRVEWGDVGQGHPLISHKIIPTPVTFHRDAKTELWIEEANSLFHRKQAEWKFIWKKQKRNGDELPPWTWYTDLYLWRSEVVNLMNVIRPNIWHCNLFHLCDDNCRWNNNPAST